MHPDGRVTSWQYLRVRLHRLSAIPALLICYAIVLNLGPFAKVPQYAASHAMTRGIAPPSIAPQPIATAEPQAEPTPAPMIASLAAPPQAELPRVEQAAQANVVQTDKDNDNAVAPSVNAPTAAPPVTPAAAIEPLGPPMEIVPIKVAAQQAQLPAAPVAHAMGAAAVEPVAGIWAPNATACSLRDLRDGWLPTIIDSEGARAGDTFCTFRDLKQIATGWRVVASCADAHEHWTAVVRLSVQHDHLIWTSNRGRQVYTRCAPEALLTAAR